ncbi:unnamed protein product [Calypogeia fissa]
MGKRHLTSTRCTTAAFRNEEEKWTKTSKMVCLFQTQIVWPGQHPRDIGGVEVEKLTKKTWPAGNKEAVRNYMEKQKAVKGSFFQI